MPTMEGLGLRDHLTREQDSVRLYRLNWTGAVSDAFRNMAPDYYVGVFGERADSQPCGEVRPVSFRTGGAAGGAANATAEEADPH